MELDEDAAPMTWNDWASQSGITRKEARELYRHLNINKSDRDRFRMSFMPIPKSKWLSIDKLEKGVWSTWSGEISDTSGSIPLDLILNPGRNS